MNTYYSIVGLDESGKLVSSYGKLYTDKREVTLKVAELQVEEYESLKDSIDKETFTDDANEERQEADEALNGFFFDMQFGTKLYSLDHETKYHTPKRFQIMTWNLEKTENEKQ